MPTASTKQKGSPVAQARYQKAMEVIESKGLRLTVARQKTLEMLAFARRPLGVLEMTAMIGDEKKCHRASIYRTVHLLEEIGVVKSFRAVGAEARYEIICDHRDGNYLTCRSCNLVRHLPHLREVKELEQRLSAKYGFANIHHTLEILGTCRTCEMSGDRRSSRAHSSRNSDSSHPHQ